MKILSIVLMFILFFAPVVQADSYEVLVVDIAGAGDSSKIEEFEKDAGQLNALHRETTHVLYIRFHRQWGFVLSGIVNFADNIHKPGGSLEYNVYEDHSENWDGDHHVNDA